MSHSNLATRAIPRRSLRHPLYALLLGLVCSGCVGASFSELGAGDAGAERSGAAANPPLSTTAQGLTPAPESGGTDGLGSVAAVDETPVGTMPVETMPVEAMPVEAMPVEAMPVEAMPVEAMPVEGAAPSHGEMMPDPPPGEVPPSGEQTGSGQETVVPAEGASTDAGGGEEPGVAPPVLEPPAVPPAETDAGSAAPAPELPPEVPPTEPNPCLVVECAPLGCPGSAPRPPEPGECCSEECLPIECEQGSACQLLTCEFGVEQLSDHCCQCSPAPELECPNSAQVCDSLACESGTLVEVGDGCCVCEAIAECSPDQLSGVQEIVETIVAEEDWHFCRQDADCELRRLETSCGLTCAVAINSSFGEIASAVAVDHAAKVCGSCAATEAACPTEALEPDCVLGRCRAVPEDRRGGRPRR